MDFDLAEMLSSYCDRLLGEVGTPEIKKKKKNGDIETPEIKKKKKNGDVETPEEKKKKKNGDVETPEVKKKKKKKDKEICKMNEDGQSNTDIGDVTDKATDEKKEKDFSITKPKITDDGFKIVSDIPPDDSDISDAFESGDEDGWDPPVMKDTESKDIDAHKDGDIVTPEVKKRKKKKKKKRKKKDDGVDKMKEDCQSNLINGDVTDKATDVQKEIKDDFSKTKPRMTDDGFKIISDIPPDDSDVSDAFESDDEADWDTQVIKANAADLRRDSKLGNIDGTKITEDGFKVVTSIPEDDSDVSDAFESDLDEDEDQGSSDRLHAPSDGSDNNEFRNHSAEEGDMEDRILVTDDVVGKNKSRKTLQRMIEDFDLGAVLQKKKNGSGTLPEQTGLPQNMKPTTTLAGRRKISSPVEVLDYSKKRGTGSSKRKLSVDKPATESTDTNTDVVTDVVADETTMKKTRFEVFKFGMSGFDKMKKKETKEALAIRLGAKPRKNKYVPYKQLMGMKKEEQVKAKDERELQRKLGYEVKKIRKNKRRDPNKVAGFDSQVGKSVAGVQVLSRKDLAKIKGTKLSKIP